MQELSKKDFESNQAVRWCPGCGDYAVLATVQKTLPELNVAKENIVFVSGIGCSSRFPYYLSTYGLHTLHGRATCYATGLKLSNPELSVFVVAGDGDLLSIGLSHFIHMIRRDIDLTVLLFNNSIYGLTKGQYSPTSKTGKEQPLNAIATALTAGCNFVARAIDTDSKNLGNILMQAHSHKGTAVIEILQNCNIFNDKVYDEYTNKKVREDRCIYLKHGEKLIYGKEQNLGFEIDKFNLVKTDKLDKILEFNNTDINLAKILSGFSYPDMPVPLGVFYSRNRV